MYPRSGAFAVVHTGLRDRDNMDKSLQYHEQCALLELAQTNVQKVRDSLDDDAPAALQQKLAVANAKISGARQFLEHGWIRCPKCKRVSYNANDIEQKYCANCSKFHFQFDLTSQEK